MYFGVADVLIVEIRKIKLENANDGTLSSLTTPMLYSSNGE